MWRNYLTVALSALTKNKIYAFINIFGLTIGLAACLLILLYVLILVFSLPGALVLVALGLLEQYGRRNPPANM